MSGAVAPGKHWTMVAGVSIFMFNTIESSITREVSSGFSVGASMSGENLFDVLIRMEEQCFDPRLCLLVERELIFNKPSFIICFSVLYTFFIC